MPFLEVNNVSKGFGPATARTAVLSGIDLEVDRGEFVAIVGFSGCGKTTLISLIAGLTRPDEGKIMLDGSEITRPGPDRGVVFQNYSLLPWLTVYENIHMAVEQVFPLWPEERRRTHTKNHIELVNLSGAEEKLPGELSGGMRQRVSVARALSTQPSVLLLDEPLGALDALTRATLQGEISRIWEQTKKTVVLITNDVDEGIHLADRIIPFTAGPGATLGPSIKIDLERPRDRRGANQSPRYKEIRREVIGFLLEQGSRRHASVTRKLTLPEIEPEDLFVYRPSIRHRAGPVRRRETKREIVEIES